MPSDLQQAIQQLLQTLSSADWNSREAAINRLLAYGEQAEPALVELLHHPDDAVRREVAQLLSQLHWNPGSHAELMLYAYASQQWDVLINIGKPALPVLEQALHDDNFYVRTSAVLALGEIGERAVVPLLERALRDANSYVRNASARALGAFGDACLPGLSMALHDEDKGVRQAAAGALVELQAVPALIEALISCDWYLRREIAQALIQIGKAAVPPLIYLLQNEAIAPEAASILRSLDVSPEQYGYSDTTATVV